MKLIQCEDGLSRCSWGVSTPDYQDYHDHEWGTPTLDDIILFEKICLEGFQSGLSWLTILRKRENFRAAFAHFDFHQVAEFGEEDVQRLLKDKGIIRHQGKIRSTINNAKRAVDLQKEFGSLGAYFWDFAPANRPCPEPIPSKTEISTRLSKDLKKRGWSFIGPTTAYAFMQAMGLVNDHLDGCCARARCDQLRVEMGSTN